MPFPNSEISPQTSLLSRRSADVHQFVLHLHAHVQDVLQRNMVRFRDTMNSEEVQAWLSDFWAHLEPYTQQASQAIETLKRQTATAIAALQDRAGVQAITFESASSATSDESDWEHVEHEDAILTPEETGAIEPEIVQIGADGSTHTVTEGESSTTVVPGSETREIPSPSKQARVSPVAEGVDTTRQLQSEPPSEAQPLPSARVEAEEALKQFYFTDLKPSARHTHPTQRSPSSHTLKPRSGQVAPISLPESIQAPSDPNKLRKTPSRHIYLPEVPNKIAGRSSPAGAIQLPDVPDSITSSRR